MLHTHGLSQFLEAFRSKHLAERVRGVDGTINNDVRDVNTAGGKLCIEGLAQHTAPAHGSGVTVLTRVAANGCRGRSHDMFPLPRASICGVTA